MVTVVAIALSITPHLAAQPAVPTVIAQTTVPSPQTAQTGYPQRTNPIINDFAQVLTPTEADNIRRVLEELKATHNIEVVVVTVDAIQKYETSDASFESFATNLFNTWGIGDADRDDGVLMLLSIGDRAVRIELGAGYSRSYDSVMQRIIDQSMLPQFKNGQYGEGLYQGSRALVAQLVVDPSQPTVAPERGFGAISLDLENNAADYAQNNPLREFLGFAPEVIFAWVLFIFVGAAVFKLLVIKQIKAFYTTYAPYLSRNAEHKCPTCQTAMEKLPQQNANHHLNRGQLLEQQLHSADYDIWRCSACSQHQTIRYQNFFSWLHHCPKCSYQTLREDRQTIERPTHHSTGTDLISQDCEYCDYEHRQTIVIPRLSSSSTSSSSGSSSSGGSSSGGGASGRW